MTIPSQIRPCDRPGLLPIVSLSVILIGIILRTPAPPRFRLGFLPHLVLILRVRIGGKADCMVLGLEMEMEDLPFWRPHFVRG